MTDKVTVQLTDDDIPGAKLSDPLEKHTNHALRWWLLCHGVQVPVSLTKAKLISRIEQAKEDDAEVCDVDGTYMFRKQQKMIGAGVSTTPLNVPDTPIWGWELLKLENHKALSSKIPRVMPGLLYTYLAEGAGNSLQSGAFRALKRGYTLWSSGRLDCIEINSQHPIYCHVRCKATPSMKSGIYSTYVLLKREGSLASIEKATCQCAAGQSASCTHVSGLLHALVSLSPSDFVPPSVIDKNLDSSGDELPITSFKCQWIQPRKRKQSNATMAYAKFDKHVYGRERKHSLQPIEDFDPRPPECIGTAKEGLTEFMAKMKGKGLGISSLLDADVRVWKEGCSSATNPEGPPRLPSKEELVHRVSAFKDSLKLPQEAIHDIEKKTTDQHQSPVWHSERRFRITASYFGEIKRRLPSTQPDSLVLRILGIKIFTAKSSDWGKKQEASALEQYIIHQKSSGHSGIFVCKSGFVICETHPFLGASPDGCVHDPSCSDPFGLVEMKCPYSQRHTTPQIAGSNKGFYCSLETTPDGVALKLKSTHIYYSQIQGQMAITQRKWCDFVVYTPKGLSVERICFNQQFWETELLSKLIEFYDNCIGPEIVSPMYPIGLPIRDLQLMN